MPDGAPARVRMINADNGPRLVTASVPFRVVAIDGTDVDGGGELFDTFVELPAGGRADLLVPVDAGGSRVGVLGGSVARPRTGRSRIRHRSRHASASTPSPTESPAVRSGRVPPSGP